MPMDIKFDFDDILIVPHIITDITSRYRDIQLPDQLPLFTAPMDTVVNHTNAQYFADRGITVCLPRTIKYTEVYKTFFNKENNLAPKLVTDYHRKHIIPSMGLNEYQELCHDNLTALLSFDKILIDVANGHMKKILDACTHIKLYHPSIKIIVGNIGNPETYRWYAESGCVDYVRVGIGNGGGCLTTKQSGVGYPMASLIHETYLVKQDIIRTQPDAIIRRKLPAIIADGGMKDYVDVIKALALGADYVMLGSIFNKCLESCAQNYVNGKKIDKEHATVFFSHGRTMEKDFRGMSTKSAQKAMGKTVIKTSEGVERRRKVEYTLESWIENFNHYLRNAMSYADAMTLEEFIGKAEICQITRNAYDRFNK